MQITLVSSGDTVFDVLNRFEANFSLGWDEIKNKFNWIEFEEKFTHWRTSIFDSEFLTKAYSIRELKAMTDFLAASFDVVDLDAPKRNSKVSLAGWIAEVLLSAREVVEGSETLEAIANQVTDTECPDCGFVHEPGQNTLCPHGVPRLEIEFLDPEEKPVYTISIHPDRSISRKSRGFTEEQVNSLPPYLLDRHGDLFEKSSYTALTYDATYVQISSQHLSNIAEEYGTPVELLTDDLVVAKYNVHGNPPPFILYQSGVYKRMTWGVISLGKIVKYSQVVSEYLSNITVV